MPTYKSIRYIVPDEAVEHTDSINALADVNTSTVAPEIGQILKWSAANSRWQPADIEESASATQKALFGFGKVQGGNGYRNMTNLISSSGVVATDTTGVGTVRDGLGGASYGGDKAIFGFGRNNDDNNDMGQKNITNLVSNTGVVASDSTGVGKKKTAVCAAGYGGDKAFFGFGMHYDYDNDDEDNQNQLNLVSNTGVVSTENTGVGTARQGAAAAGYGGDKAIIGFGYSGQRTNITNLVSNTGIVSSDVTGVGTARSLAAASYGGDKAIFGFGWTGSNLTNVTNLVSNAGVVASDTTGVGTARDTLAGVGYGGDKAIFGFGYTSGETNVTNLVSNAGVVATDTTGVGTSRRDLAAAGYSSTA